MAEKKVSIDQLIEIVSRGGAVKTGVDVYNQRGLLLIGRDVLVNNVNILLTIKKNGVLDVPISHETSGGLWDSHGNAILFKDEASPGQEKLSTVQWELKKIEELRREAQKKYDKAKNNIKKVITDIKKTGGEFDYQTVEETVTELLNFLTVNETAFSYLTKEIFSYDDYLYNHSINVCTISLAVINRFNNRFSTIVNRYLNNRPVEGLDDKDEKISVSYLQYLPEELRDIALGFFLHDVGKVLIPDEILNKAGRLTDAEFEVIKQHSYVKGPEILERNGLQHNPFIRNLVQYHHCKLYADEGRCYPLDKTPIEVPVYVKICKLADIYDAMTSKRVYKEAVNPIVVVTDIFRSYAEKDSLLQLILHSFVKAVGIYPPGSVVTLRNRQLAYVLNSDGPVVIPFTDQYGNTIQTKMDPINLEDETLKSEGFEIDRRKLLQSPTDAYEMLPAYLRQTVN